MEKRESFGHHRWVYVKILLFSAAGKKMDVFDEKNIYRMSSIVFLRSRSYLACVGLARPSSFATRWCFYALACD